MSRVGRGLAAAVVAISLGAAGGCARFDEKPVEVAPPSVDADCVVGTWHQREGWQRLVTDDLVTEIRLISGGRTFVANADGTGTVEYTTPAFWKNTGGLEVTYSGRSTLTFTASDGEWSEVADATGVTTQLTLNGRKDQPRAGVAGRTLTGTYRCGETDLIISGEGFRQAFVRA